MKRHIKKALVSTIERDIRSIEAAASGDRFSTLSIDLFDTLVYRRCSKPTSVFAIQYRRFAHSDGLGFSLQDWVQMRIRVEQELTVQASPREIHLDEIYASIGTELDLDAEATERLNQSELAAERSVIRPYPAAMAMLERLHAAGKRILINTDTYLPESFIRSILDAFVPMPYSLQCSSASGAPKRTGGSFSLLKQTYGAAEVLHVGDNFNSDVVQARRGGFEARLIRWERPSALARNAVFLDYLAALGIQQFETPFERDHTSPILAARAELAWRWASVLTDFTLAVRRHAARIGADEIWFLSRDCESLFAGIEPNRDRLFPGVAVKYVYTSRSASYPIVATSDAERYRQWTDQAVDDNVLNQGKQLAEAYRSQLEPGTKTILAVDTGWKGRALVALQEALGDVAVRGFYMSLGPDAEDWARQNSGSFLDWDDSVLSQAGAEALAGFTGPSCTGYARSPDGHWVPTFRERGVDVCPDDYAQGLRFFLTQFLSEADLDLDETPREARIQAVRTLLAFPDRTVALAFEGWGIAAGASGEVVGSIAKGGEAGFADIVLGRYRNGNLWPQLAMWNVAPSRSLARLLQWAMVSRRRLSARSQP